MASNDRFYQLEFRHRPVMKGDIGSLLSIQGLVVGGNGAQAILLLPSNTLDDDPENIPPFKVLTLEEWSDWLQRSDVPEIFASTDRGLTKAFHRKVRYEISGAIQQRVWKADGCKCMYCNRELGDVQLTIDHFIPLEMGGVNGPSNYLSACRKCNKDKGGQDPKEFCASKGISYDFLVDYLKDRKV